LKYPLAIIVPAYKARYLSRALETIDEQTDPRFQLYVADDASSEPIIEIVRRFPRLTEKLVFNRFEQNLGGQSLTRQWDRCIRLTAEPWVWLFSDDDEMEPDCVAAFYRQLEATNASYDYYRFNAVVIDARGTKTALCPPHPAWETAREYAYFFLRGVRRATQQEAVFRREHYDRIGGFPELPLAWYADTAFGVACGEARGIFTLPGPKTLFRLSGENISSKRSAGHDRRKRQALMMFVAFIDAFVARTSGENALPTDQMLRTLLHEHLLRRLRGSGRYIGPVELYQLRMFIRQRFPEHLLRDTLRLILHDAGIVPAHIGRCLRSVFSDVSV
jgi:glycosyltransferase involved in cell wall biosynthesis